MTSSSKTTGAARTIWYNVLVFFVLFNVLYWSIPTIGTLLRATTSFNALIRSAPAEASTFERVRWVMTNWGGRAGASYNYRSHIGWRRGAVESPAVNVGGPYLQRRTVNDGTSPDRQVYFFGGSTMWGDGVHDGGTIPSHFSARTGTYSENFGEAGYIAHQSLALLIQLLQSGRRPDLVVFYDGVNDALHKCRSELTPDAHEQERRFDSVLRTSSDRDSFLYYFGPILGVADNIKREMSRGIAGDEYECHRNPEKAAAIAEKLIQDWQFAKRLVEWHGGKFIGILQPVAYFSRTPLGHLDAGLVPARNRPQYEAVYPIIREKIARLGDGFYDLVSILDVDETVYIDFCHLTPNGNRLVAEKIAELVEPLGFRR